MKCRSLCAALAFLASVSGLLAQPLSSPGTTCWYTNGFATVSHYSNGRSSQEYSGYGTLSLADRHFFTIGYGDLSIRHSDWTYRQRMVTGAASLYRQPWRAKFTYSRILGDYSARQYEYGYSDHADLAGAELLYATPSAVAGAAVCRFDGTGYLHRISQQYTLRLSHSLGRRIWAELRPNYVWLLDGRRLTSAALKLVWSPSSDWRFTAGGFAGKRAYYFDNDLLVVFNQDETQKGLIFAQAERRLVSGLWLDAEALRTTFEGYNVVYWVAGIKTRLPL